MRAWQHRNIIIGVGVAVVLTAGLFVGLTASPGSPRPARAATTIVIDSNIGETFAPAPRNAAPKLTAEQAFALQRRSHSRNVIPNPCRRHRQAGPADHPFRPDQPAHRPRRHQGRHRLRRAERAGLGLQLALVPDVAEPLAARTGARTLHQMELPERQHRTRNRRKLAATATTTETEWSQVLGPNQRRLSRWIYRLARVVPTTAFDLREPFRPLWFHGWQSRICPASGPKWSSLGYEHCDMRIWRLGGSGFVRISMADVTSRLLCLPDASSVSESR